MSAAGRDRRLRGAPFAVPEPTGADEPHDVDARDDVGDNGHPERLGPFTQPLHRPIAPPT